MESKCLHNVSGDPYIVSIVAGLNTGPEAKSAGKNFNWGFVVEFKTMEDLVYYAEEDPEHAQVKRLLSTLLADVFVYDIEY